MNTGLAIVLSVLAVLMSAGGFCVVCTLPLVPTDLNILGVVPLIGGFILAVWVAGRLGMFASYGPHS